MESQQRRIEALTALLTPHAAQVEAVRTLLEDAKEDCAAIKHGVEDAMGRLHIDHRVPPTPHLANKVFGTPGLLENILTFASIPDLLRAYRVNKTFLNLIEGSALLQRRLGLLPDHDCHLRLPAQQLITHSSGVDMDSVFFGGISSRLTGESVLEPNTVPIQINGGAYRLRNKTAELVKIRPLGERCRNMLITQPPIKEMRVYLQCCTPDYLSYRPRQSVLPERTISCESGITAEQIWTVISTLQSEHRLCPDADADDHDDEGYVHPRIRIEGTLALKLDDPMLMECKRRQQECLQEEDEWNAKDARFAPYIAAKRSGE